MFPRGPALLVLILVALAIVIGIVVSAGDDPQEPKAPRAIAIDGPDADGKRDDRLQLSKPAEAELQEARRVPESKDLGGGLRGFDPQPAGLVEGPLAGQEWPGCRTRFVRNFSSRRGARIKAIWLHYTAGGERPGWADVDGLTAYANNPSSQVSWHFLIDREGHCNYTVPLQYKAWTQGNANPTAVGIEVHGTGRERDYAGTAGFRKLRAVVRRISRIYRVPIRVGSVSNCVVTRSGVLTHWMGGRCSGGHVDIRPYNLVAVVRKLAPPRVTSVDRVTCRKLNWWRRAGRPHGKAERNAIRRRGALARRGVTCTAKGPVRA